MEDVRGKMLEPDVPRAARFGRALDWFLPRTTERLLLRAVHALGHRVKRAPADGAAASGMCPYKASSHRAHGPANAPP
jgi:hypothetical protein